MNFILFINEINRKIITGFFFKVFYNYFNVGWELNLN